MELAGAKPNNVTFNSMRSAHQIAALGCPFLAHSWIKAWKKLRGMTLLSADIRSSHVPATSVAPASKELTTRWTRCSWLLGKRLAQGTECDIARRRKTLQCPQTSKN